MKPGIPEKYHGLIAAGLAFVASYCFFQFVYPYHLIRREQMNLFMYDWEYITETYKGAGCLSRFIGDFVDQFLYFPVIGPVIVSLILTGIGTVAYRICRHGLGKWASFGIAFVIFGWSFMRETENQFITQYSIVTLCYLSLILAALQFRKKWMKPVAMVLFLGVGVLCLGSPYHKYYGKLWGHPIAKYDKIIELDVEAFKGNWDKVSKLSKNDLHFTQACYFYNLATGMKGELGDKLFDHSQNYADGLFMWVSDQVSQFTNGMAGEVWYNLGDMTLAEQSTVVALQSSPKHTGTRYLVRLAQITLISGEYGSAQKYLDMLSKTLVYRKWAKSMMPENQSEATKTWLTEARSKLTKTDIVYGRNDFRPILKALLEANPDNYLAREYLLAYDLLYFDLNAFMEDYNEKPVPGKIYEEALLICLSLRQNPTQEQALEMGISKQTMNRMVQFNTYPDRYTKTYWYYYMQAATQQATNE